MCQQKKKPSTRISLTRKVDQDRPSSNGWIDREFDDSSNSNSLDGACVDENMSTLKEKSAKTAKSEADVDITENVTISRRKRTRAMKAIVTDDAIHSDEEKSLNICWNADETHTINIKEESISPIDDTNSDSGSNNTGEADAKIKVIKTEDTNHVKEEKRTRSSNGNSSSSNSIKTTENKAKPKLSSSHCKYCFKKFSNASNLRRHITMSHFGPKKFTCNLCTFRARRKIDILSHMRTKHQFGGERTDAFKFVTINDDPAPKPTPSSVNRRKERHTEVLRDDEEEIFIDSEAFVDNENDQQMLALGESNENSNADLDEEPVEHNEESGELTESNKSNALKRKGRPKAKDKFKKLGRSTSPGDNKEGESLPARRPVRNRIMPVKKDFVYDLSTLLKKDYKDFQDDFQKQILPQPGQPQTQSQAKSRNTSPSPTTVDIKPNKRRNMIPDSADSAENDEQSVTDQSDQKDEPKQTPSQPQQDQKDESSPSQIADDMNVIKGAAEAMAQQAVQANRAAFFKPPELPAERPLSTPQRQFDSNSIKDWPILKRPPAIYDGLKSKLSNLKVPGIKRKKRTCMLKHANLNSNSKSRLHDKHKIVTNGHIDSRLKCNDSEQTMKISSKLADKMQLKSSQSESDNTETDQSNILNSESISSTNSLPTASNKEQQENVTPRRMTLLERLAENKTKKLNESLSRMTIANSDNDTDED